MKQSIVILPKFKEIEKLRKKYNINHSKYKTHISLVYTFEVKNQKSLFEHIKESIKKIKQFEISSDKFYNSKNFVCLNIKSKECWKIYKLLNKGILAGFENKEVKFQPHITITISKTAKEAKVLVKKLNTFKIKQKYNVNSIYILTLKEDNSIKSIKKFKLTA